MKRNKVKITIEDIGFDKAIVERLVELIKECSYFKDKLIIVGTSGCKYN